MANLFQPVTSTVIFHQFRKNHQVSYESVHSYIFLFLATCILYNTVSGVWPGVWCTLCDWSCLFLLQDWPLKFNGQSCNKNKQFLSPLTLSFCPPIGSFCSKYEKVFWYTLAAKLKEAKKRRLSIEKGSERCSFLYQGLEEGVWIMNINFCKFTNHVTFWSDELIKSIIDS